MPTEDGSASASITDEIAAWEEQRRREAAAFKERLAAQKAEAMAQLAAIEKAEALLTEASILQPAMPPQPQPRPRRQDPPRAQDPAPVQADALRRQFRGANLPTIIAGLLAMKNDQTFAELAEQVRKIKARTSDGSIHSALGRMRNAKVRFDGARPSMKYHLLAPGESAESQDDGGSPDTPAERIVAALREVPRRPIRELAAIAYDRVDDKTQSAVRSTLDSLRKDGRVVNVARGEWEAAEEE